VPESTLVVNQEMKPVTDGEIILEGEDRELAPHKGSSFRFSTPVEIPGVSVTNFIRSAINETRKANGEEDMRTKC
jgi:Fe-S cluster assembly ATP-binding protein